MPVRRPGSSGPARAVTRRPPVERGAGQPLSCVPAISLLVLLLAESPIRSGRRRSTVDGILLTKLADWPCRAPVPPERAALKRPVRRTARQRSGNCGSCGIHGDSSKVRRTGPAPGSATRRPSAGAVPVPARRGRREYRGERRRAYCQRYGGIRSPGADPCPRSWPAGRTITDVLRSGDGSDAVRGAAGVHAGSVAVGAGPAEPVTVAEELAVVPRGSLRRRCPPRSGCAARGYGDRARPGGRRARQAREDPLRRPTNSNVVGKISDRPECVRRRDSGNGALCDSLASERGLPPQGRGRGARPDRVVATRACVRCAPAVPARDGLTARRCGWERRAVDSPNDI